MWSMGANHEWRCRKLWNKQQQWIQVTIHSLIAWLVLSCSDLSRIGGFWWLVGEGRELRDRSRPLCSAHTHTHTHTHTTQSPVPRLHFCKQIRAMSEDEKVTEDLHGMRETEAPKVNKNLIRVLGNLIISRPIQKITFCTFKRFLGRCWRKFKSSAMLRAVNRQTVTSVSGGP